MLNSSHLRRRNFLVGLGSFTTLSVIGCSSNDDNLATLQLSQTRDFSVSQARSLRELAKQKGLFYGAFPENPRAFMNNDFAIQDAFKRECGLVVGGFYWRHIRPAPQTFDWSIPDIAFKFAKQNQMLFRGHPLIWHRVYPPWMMEKLQAPDTTRKEVESILETHISTIVRRYAGQTHSWDVINEPIDPTKPYGLRPTPWIQKMGIDAIDFAFRVAAEADPKALLVFNEFGIEYGDSYQERKRKSTLKILEQLKARGTPVHALGIQAHLFGNRPAALKPLRTFLSDVAALGLKIIVTELDVEDRKLPANWRLRDRMIASAYEDFLGIVLAERAVIGVITWGLSDRYSWLSGTAPRADRLPVRPLPLDKQMQRKLAWNAIARSFTHAPSR
jgi:endo-1,4-beta-xylanase